MAFMAIKGLSNVHYKIVIGKYKRIFMQDFIPTTDF